MKIYDKHSETDKLALLDSFKLSHFSINIVDSTKYRCFDREELEYIFWIFKELLELFPESDERFLVRRCYRNFTRLVGVDIDYDFFRISLNIFMAFYMVFLNCYKNDPDCEADVSSDEIEYIFDNIVFGEKKDIKVRDYVKRFKLSGKNI